MIEERTEESSSQNQTPPSALNPMEGTNYQDELNNFIKSRTGPALTTNGKDAVFVNSGITSVNNSNRQGLKNGGGNNSSSVVINSNRFQYVASKFESEEITPHGTIPQSHNSIKKRNLFFCGANE